MPHSKQIDSSSCGILVCKFAHAFLHDPAQLFFPVDARAIDQYRKEIWQCLVRAAENAKDLCLKCGEVDVPSTQRKGQKNNWVRAYKKYENYRAYGIGISPCTANCTSSLATH